MRLIFIKKFCNLSKIGGFHRGEEQSCVKKKIEEIKKRARRLFFIMKHYYRLFNSIGTA